MIEPQVEHGGASSWFWMAANFDPPFATGAASAGLLSCVPG